MADRTYRRARQALIASGELILLRGVGGRGNTNRWQIQDPRPLAGDPERPSRGRRVAPPPGARPLVASLTKLAANERPTGHVAGDRGIGELDESEAAGSGKAVTIGHFLP